MPLKLVPGFESVAQEFLGPKRWKRMTSGLPCPPASGAKSESRTRGKQGVDNSVEEKEGSGPVISHDVVPGESTTGGPDSESGNKDDGPVEPMDWDPLTTDCLNCALKKAEQEKCLRLVSVSFIMCAMLHIRLNCLLHASCHTESGSSFSLFTL